MAMILATSVRNTARGFVRAMSGGYGDGVGKGGGGGGSIRDAGGAFGKMEAAREDEYFYKKQKQQLEELKAHLQQEIQHHEKQLEEHRAAMERHQQRVKEIEESQKK
ncbi:ATPase inhibitor mai-2, mitochondrial [Parelaphostrongylus tenuis]|uniref:ATPase inhibitor, mitochondrial n=1 Tax=Parelaphostrongylus tenuis TaxID=148309 RepID=A0AAD5MFS5_PARTN|nr:ATPase inhibitor mai-2, mitochondrial [Parelaphostrongylus tenuis]